MTAASLISCAGSVLRRARRRRRRQVNQGLRNSPTKSLETVEVLRRGEKSLPTHPPGSLFGKSVAAGDERKPRDDLGVPRRHPDGHQRAIGDPHHFDWPVERGKGRCNGVGERIEGAVAWRLLRIADQREASASWREVFHAHCLAPQPRLGEAPHEHLSSARDHEVGRLPPAPHARDAALRNEAPFCGRQHQRRPCRETPARWNGGPPPYGTGRSCRSTRQVSFGRNVSKNGKAGA